MKGPDSDVMENAISTAGITHHFRTELLSTSDSILIPYLNTKLPIHHDFCLSPYNHHQTAFINTAIDQHVQSR